MVSEDRAPPALRQVLTWDEQLTDRVVRVAHQTYPPLTSQNWRSIFKILEISCHGVPWLALNLIWMYMLRSGREYQVNLMAALILDIVAVALIKAVTRRQRPRVDPDHERMFFTHGPDKFSFPSGHASRAVMLTLFFGSCGDCVLVNLVVGSWAAAICASRVLMRRHHLLDVAAGAFFGVIEYALVCALWFGPQSSSAIASWITGAEDEFDGS